MAGKIKKLFNEIKDHWNAPALGKYVPYKEYLSVFGGVNFNYAMKVSVNMLSFSASCYLIMYHYNLPYLTFSIISLIGLPLSYLWNFIGWIVNDNLGYLPKNTEKKMIAFYSVAAALGIGLILSDFSLIIPSTSQIGQALDSMAGINTRTFFKIFGVQVFISGYSGLRSLLWQKKLIKKFGRYKYRLYCDVWPKAILFILLGWLPIYNITDTAERVWIIYLLFQIYGVYSVKDHVENCTNYISPDSEERILVRTWPRQLGHVLNSILDFLIPVVIALMPDKFGDIAIYRYLLPATYTLCAIGTMFFAPKIKERMPQPAIEKKVHIKFWDGVFGVLRNKYTWINTISDLLNALGDGMLSFDAMILLYCMRADGIIYSIIVAVTAFIGAVPKFISAPILKKYSFKTLKITGLAARGMVLMMMVASLYFFSSKYLLMAIMMVLGKGLINFVIGVPTVAQDDMNCKVLDYQMYISGERLENFKGIFSLIISPITTIIGLIIPILLLRNGYNSNWDVLFLDKARFNIMAIPLLIDGIGYFLMIIPYLFWDYDEKKQKIVMDELKRRAKILGGTDFDAEAKALQEADAKAKEAKAAAEAAKQQNA